MMGVRVVDLLCSPNAHTRSNLFLESRCSSKRAVGDQSALALERNEQAWKDHYIKRKGGGIPPFGMQHLQS